MRPNPTNILELLESGEAMTKSEILSTLGTYDLAAEATTDLTPQETFEYYTNLDGLFYSSIKRIRTNLKKNGTGIKLVSIEKAFQLTSEADRIQEYLNTPQRIGRTGAYLDTIQGIQGDVSEDVQEGETKSKRITEAAKRFESYRKVA